MWRAIAGVVVAVGIGSASISPPGRAASVPERRLSRIPDTVLWAWERPDDLREFPEALGVAFLAQTITLGNGTPALDTRRQPLRVAGHTPLVAVTRIESPRPKRIALNIREMRTAVDAIAKSATLPGVVGVQIDFDATASQRPLYLALLHAVRDTLPADASLSITALASWCVGDRWLRDAPVDEVVPMLFRMGPATDPLKSIAGSVDGIDPACRGAVGASLDEPLRITRNRRRVYLFNPRPWKIGAVDAIEIVTP
jgi:hypothetical protein